MTPMVHLELQISTQIVKKIETSLIGYSGALSKQIHKKPEVKILWHCPFKCRWGREYHWECEGFRFREIFKNPSPQKTQENTNHFLKEWRDSSGLGQLVYKFYFTFSNLFPSGIWGDSLGSLVNHNTIFRFFLTNEGMRWTLQKTIFFRVCFVWRRIVH